jgi:hypothetical protein
VWWTLTFTAEEPAAHIAALDVSAAAVYRAPSDTSTDAGGPIMTILRYRIVRLAMQQIHHPLAGVNLIRL